MKTKLLLFGFFTFLFIFSINAQVGVGNTNPQASLDISASSTTSPANNDGILIPRMSTFPSAPGATRDGMLIFYTGTGADGKGFYYWDQTLMSWVSLKGTNDSDWYEEGSTNQPDDINDNIYTQGNVGIGQNTPVNPLHIGISTPFNTAVANTGQDGIFIIGNNASGKDAVGGSISFGGAHPARKNSRRAAISSTQTGIDEDNVGLSFYVHQGPINTAPMVEGMRLTHNRRLGINNTDPSANLDVIGTLQYEDGNETIGFVLTSDATGNATWTDPNALIMGVEKIDDLSDGKSDSDGSQDGSSIFLGINAGIADDSSDNRNVGVGYLAMEDNTIGSQNTAVGYNALLNNTEGTENTAIGSASLDANTTGIWNTAVGQASLSANIDGSYNTALGRGSLGANNNGHSNVTLGVWALSNSTSGSFNTVIGTEAGNALSGESSNTIIGRRAMNSYTAGGENVAIGAAAGYYGSGIQNTFIGTSAGNLVGTGERNGSVFIGYGAGSSETTSNKLYIENSTGNADNALIYGEFDTNIIRTNGELQIGNPTGTGYALPTNQGTAAQVLTSNGDGTTQWTVPTITHVMNNPQFPDGFIGLNPILISGSTLTYTVPTGKNFYITNIFSNNTNYTVSIDSKLIQSRFSNVTLYTAITNPILVAQGEVITRSNAGTSINGFLVDAVVDPITQTITTTSSYTVPVGKILILLSGHKSTIAANPAIRITADGATLFDGFSNTSIPNYETTSFHQPMFLPAGTILTSINSVFDHNINGYLIDL